MKKILIDTNAYSAFLSGDNKILKQIIGSDIVYLSTIVIGELYYGFHGGSRFEQNKEYLEIFLKKSNVQILNVSIETAEIFGEIQMN